MIPPKKTTLNNPSKQSNMSNIIPFKEDNPSKQHEIDNPSKQSNISNIIPFKEDNQLIPFKLNNSVPSKKDLAVLFKDVSKNISPVGLQSTSDVELEKPITFNVKSEQNHSCYVCKGQISAQRYHKKYTHFRNLSTGEEVPVRVHTECTQLMTHLGYALDWWPNSDIIPVFVRGNDPEIFPFCKKLSCLKLWCVFKTYER